MIDPVYIDTSRIIELTGDMWKVNGRVSAISIAPVRPGIAPTTMPAAVPSDDQQREATASSRPPRLAGVSMPAR